MHGVLNSQIPLLHLPTPVYVPPYSPTSSAYVGIYRRFSIAASGTEFPSRALVHVAPGGDLPHTSGWMCSVPRHAACSNVMAFSRFGTEIRPPIVRLLGSPSHAHRDFHSFGTQQNSGSVYRSKRVALRLTTTDVLPPTIIIVRRWLEDLGSPRSSILERFRVTRLPLRRTSRRRDG